MHKLLMLCTLASGLSAVPARAAPQAVASEAVLSLAEFDEVLAGCLDDLERLKLNPGYASAWLQRLPSEWKVRDQARIFAVRTDFLQSHLAVYNPDNQNAGIVRTEMRDWVHSLRREASELSAPVKEGVEPEEQLKSILGRGEFRGVGEPGYLQLLMKRLQLQIIRFLDWLFGSVRRSGMGDYLVWLLIALLVFLLGTLLVRTLRNAGRREADKIEPTGAPLPVRSWRQWLAACEKCAARGDFRAAVHAGYWAGAVWLEETGSLTADPARTPRESLRLLGVSDPRRTPLRRMTESLEVTWYGYRNATPTDVTDLRARLEELGCPVNASRATAAS